MTWTNEGLPLIVNSSITEYDISHGNTSIMQEYGLAPQQTIDELNRLGKDERNRRVGLLQRDDKVFAARLEAGFNDAVEKFCERNDLDVEVDVLAIRRDAVFVVNKPVNTVKLSPSIHFRPKVTYHAFLQLGPRWEFYFHKDGYVDIKNFVQEKNDISGCLTKLKPGPIAMLQEFIDVCEATNMDKRKIYQWIKNFSQLYKERQLDPEYYREFTRDANFRLDILGEMTFSDIVTDDLIDENLMIDFNYIQLIIPLIRTVL